MSSHGRLRTYTRQWLKPLPESIKGAEAHSRLAKLAAKVAMAKEDLVPRKSSAISRQSSVKIQMRKPFCVGDVVVVDAILGFYGGSGGIGMDHVATIVNVAVFAVENGWFLSNLQRLLVVKVRGMRREDLPAANSYRRPYGYDIR